MKLNRHTRLIQIIVLVMFINPVTNAKSLLYGTAEEALTAAQSVFGERAEAASFIPGYKDQLIVTWLGMMTEADVFMTDKGIGNVAILQKNGEGYIDTELRLMMDEETPPPEGFFSEGFNLVTFASKTYLTTSSAMNGNRGGTETVSLTDLSTLQHYEINVNWGDENTVEIDSHLQGSPEAMGWLVQRWIKNNDAKQLTLNFQD